MLQTANDTWGLSGPTFLALFLALSALVLLASVTHRARLFAGRNAPVHHRITAQQAAHLNDGDELALYAALGGLRAAGAIDVAKGALIASGPLPAGATRLDQAIHEAARLRIMSQELLVDPGVTAALAQLRRELEAADLALSPATRRVARIGPLLLVVLLLVGVARLISSTDKPVGFLLLSLAALFVLCLIQLMHVPSVTCSARRLLKELRTQHSHLTPRNRPAYRTYGADLAAMGVALFGVAALRVLDPAFAQTALITQYASYSTYPTQSSGTAGSGGGCSGGGGCGG
ncbi:MAG TPA: TIGR04222 domain-containing membrane protein [Micromonospora sp.]|nr:TIGR04222 domain-containing membrane protein [Micromonospora sp.]